MKHTRLPWCSAVIHSGKYRGGIGIFNRAEMRGNLFCVLPRGSVEIQAANAALIVSACNAHAVLVDALRLLKETIEEGGNIFAAIAAANAALKLAEGQ